VHVFSPHRIDVSKLQVDWGSIQTSIDSEELRKLPVTAAVLVESTIHALADNISTAEIDQTVKPTYLMPDNIPTIPSTTLIFSQSRLNFGPPKPVKFNVFLYLRLYGNLPDLCTGRPGC
jgi:hypothetical protein